MGALSNLDLNESKGKHRIGQWDQFKANGSKFGVQVGFDENKYTTVNPINNLNPEEKLFVEQKAKEIESGLNSISGSMENPELANKTRDKGGKMVNKNDLDKGEEYEAEEDSDEDEEIKYSMVKRYIPGTESDNNKDNNKDSRNLKQDIKEKANRKEDSKLLDMPPGLNTTTTGSNLTPKRSYREAALKKFSNINEININEVKNPNQNDGNNDGIASGQQKSKTSDKKEKSITDDGKEGKRLDETKDTNDSDKTKHRTNEDKGKGKGKEENIENKK